MKVIKVRNVHDALPRAITELKKEGIQRESRNGPVLVFNEPVTTVYEKPLERVIFHEDRDANPYFHLMESLWMLGGRNDVAFVQYYASNMKSYSDNGKTFHAAYGHRWRKHFSRDQLKVVIEALKKNPDDRRVVLSMWDCESDLGFEGKDFPCNLQAIFSRGIEGELNMTVTNRSNDIVWGAYGANAVHFSYLMEYIAAGIGCKVGKYYQMSNNLHAYLDTYKKVKDVKIGSNPYDEGIEHFPLVSIPLGTWDQDLQMFLDNGPIVGFRDPFFRRVVTPMYYSYAAFKKKDDPDRFEKALDIINQCQDTAWKAACIMWLARRKKNAENSK